MIPRTSALVLALGLACAGGARADYSWNWTNLSSPNWDISVTDFGYSDYLLDHTPGFVGREYLSGEWGGAVAYTRASGGATPTWLEPRFSYPDWDTNSTYSVLQPMTSTGPTAQGLPSFQSVVGNGVLQITQDLRIVDTVTGVRMGLAAASQGGAGMSILSDRYVLAQSYSFRNVGSEPLTGLQFFQFLHGLNSERGVYDNRAYGGAMGEYRYDVTQAGQDVGSAAGQYDYIGFHSRIAPSAVEIGHYGIEGIDDHAAAVKPSVGTHLSVENNALDGVDAFAPAQRWVGGAQRFDLGALQPGQAVVFDTLLTIRTGWLVGGGDSGSVNGGGGVPGGVDYVFLGTHGSGQIFVEYEREDADGIAGLIDRGEIGPLGFALPGDRLQLFVIEFEGSFTGMVRLTFGFDGSLLAPGLDPSELHVFHWTGASWEDLGGSVDAAGSRITFETASLSPFALGVPVPEPATWALMLLGVAWLTSRRLSDRRAARAGR